MIFGDQKTIENTKSFIQQCNAISCNTSDAKTEKNNVSENCNDEDIKCEMKQSLFLKLTDYSSNNSDVITDRSCNKDFSIHDTSTKENIRISNNYIEETANSTPNSKSICTITELSSDQKTNLDLLRKIKDNTFEGNSSLFRRNNVEPTAAYFFFARKKGFREFEYLKRSRKSTNLVKYKNIFEEPKLQKPFSKCMLLGRVTAVKSSKADEKICKIDDNFSKSDKRSHTHESVVSKNVSIGVVLGSKEFKNKCIQDIMSASEYSKIAERILLSIFENHNPNSSSSPDYVKTYVNKIVEELYEVKLHNTDVHPVKKLFRCLLEFWLKNNTSGAFQNVTKGTKSIGPEANSSYTVDKIISSIRVSLQSRGTQYHLNAYGFKPPQSYRKSSDASKLVGKPPKVKKEKIKPPLHSPRRDTESFEKERRVQELERMLKNTVYVCDNIRSVNSKEKDVKITKTLLNNIGTLSKTTNIYNTGNNNESSSSAEIPKIQETIDNLISDTKMPPAIAKEFLNAYLGVLDDPSKSATENSTSPSGDTVGKPVQIECEVMTDAVQKKLSKSIITENKSLDIAKDKNKVIDPGQQYLKDILDKVTTLFSKINIDRGQKNSANKSKTQNKIKDELGRSVKEYPGKNLVREDFASNSVVIDLSKYDLEHISMFSDPDLKGIMSITIKLKEKPMNHGETQRAAHLNLKFSDDALKTTQIESKPWIKLSSNSSSKIFDAKKRNCKRNILDINAEQNINDLKPYLSSCEIGSKAYCKIVHESEHSLDLSFKSSKYYQHSTHQEKNEDPQSCYIMSFQKNKIAPNLTQVKKRVRLKECHGLVLNSRTNSSTKQKSKYPDEYGVFENPAPKIIDEKFILLLLENLTFLAKDLPGLFKDINSLYIKLKKKHEKVVKNCVNIQGLSLLGKIYNENNNNKPNDIETCISTKDFRSKTHIATSTSDISTEKVIAETNTSNTINENVIAAMSTGKIKDETVVMGTNTSNIVNAKNTTETNTDSVEIIDDKKVNDITKVHKQNEEIMTEAFILEIQSLNEASSPKRDVYHSYSSSQTIRYNDGSSREQFATAEHATSRQNWYSEINTKDCAISTVIKCILNNDYELRKPNKLANPEVSVPKKSKKERKATKHDLIKEIRLLSPSFKITTPSQTDQNFQTDYHVFQVYTNKNEIDSMSDSSEIRHWRSEIKLLYKCRSEPSLTSG
ncbi:uncharacterized protein LOC132903356 [Amyelois transitella]|uniref:uncharacterized protein LOC132903356 n=1 Tax=Amyelois transitella TaxID=680683 RepID=UPI0029905B6B|nr:uncharacterized protein LOC132903356 [Amyelois transitella]